MAVPNRPAFDDAGIYSRPNGRMFCLSIGRVDESDRGEKRGVPPTEGYRSYAPEDEQSGGGTRQAITQFSKRSRRRLRRTLHGLRRDASSLFLTLTFHETDPSPQEAKGMLDRFWKRIRRAFPEASCVWKMEPQERGVPHFHMIVYGVPFLPIGEVSQAWHECTSETSEAHRKSGVDLERQVHSDDGKLQSYLAKYLGKECEAPETWERPGRFWGVRERDSLPWANWDFVARMDRADVQRVIFDLLDEWEVDLPDYVDIPTLTVCCRGNPDDAFEHLR